MSAGTSPENCNFTSEAALRLILAAEELFAQQGIEATSLREIAAHAENGNNNAVKYHFGSKTNLIFAIHNMRVMQMEEMRKDLLNYYHNNDRKFYDLLKALFIPQIQFVNNSGIHTFVHFQADYLSRYSAAGLPHPVGDHRIPADALFEISQLINNNIPPMPDFVREERGFIANLTFLNMIMRCDYNNNLSKYEFDILIEDTIRSISSYLTSPFCK